MVHSSGKLLRFDRAIMSGGVCLNGYTGIICAALHFLVLLAPMTAADDDAAAQLEKEALRSLLERISGATMELELTYSSEHRETEARIRTAFEAQRVKYVLSFRNKKKSAGEFGSWSSPEYAILHGDVILSRNSGLENSNFIENQSFYPDLYASKHLFWPQFIGTSTSTVWRMPTESPRGFLEQGGREVMGISSEEEDGIQLRKVDYRMTNGFAMSAWFSPAQGGLVVKLHESVLSSGGQYETVVNTRLKEWQPELWFPEEIVTERRIGSRLVESEVVRVVDADFSALDEAEFGVEALEIPEGGVIYDSTDGEGTYFLVEKSGIVPMSDKQILAVFPPTDNRAALLRQESAPLENSNSSSIYWLILANLIAVVGFGMFLVWRRR